MTRAPQPGEESLAIVMITLNEAHNIEAVLDNIADVADEIFLVDSFSTDDTVGRALARGVKVYQRPFRGFGDQWNFAVRDLPIRSAWTMKLDPDERLSPELKASLKEALRAPEAEAFTLRRRLWFMNRPLPVRQEILRVWRTGSAVFSDVLVNEHPVVQTRPVLLDGELQHLDSAHLHHWFDKQNKYSTLEARSAFAGSALAATPRLLGSGLQRRMWLKANFSKLPLRFALIHLWYLVAQGAWRAGRAGWIWSHLRAEIFRVREFKRLEMQWLGRAYDPPAVRLGDPHPGAVQVDAAAPGGER